MLAAGKALMILDNGDMIEDGKLLLVNTKQESDGTLTPSSLVLSTWFTRFNTFIPLTTCNHEFLMLDQLACSQRKSLTEAKIDEGILKMRVYGGNPPPDKICMQL